MGKHSWKIELLLAGSWRGASSALVTDGRWRIVVDTGMPHEAPQLVKALAARGIAPEDVGTVINTHFHVDHVLNNCLFPRAEIFASQQSYDWCRALYSDVRDDRNWEVLTLKYYPETFQYERAKTHMHKLRKLALRWWDETRLGDPSRFRWIETCPLPDGMEPIVTSGHVPGHISIVIPGDNGSGTTIAGDALLSREHDEEILTMIPHNREQSSRDRSRFLALGGRILPGHDAEFIHPSSPV